MNSKSIKKIIIFLGISFTFYFSLIFYFEVDSLEFSNIKFKIDYYPLIIGILIIHTLFHNLRFYRLLHNLKIRISFIESLKISLAGMALGFTPGGIGTAIKCHIIKNKFGNSISYTLPVIFLERITELIGIIFVLLFLNLIVFNLHSLIISIIGIIFVTIFFLVISTKLFYKLVDNLISKISIFKQLSSSLENSRESIKQLLKNKIIIESIVYSIISKLIYLIAIYYIFISFDIDLGIPISATIYYTSLLVGVMSFIPAGIIVTESSMITVLSQYGINFSLATLVVIVLRIIGTWILSLFGTLTYIIFYRKS